MTGRSGFILAILLSLAACQVGGADPRGDGVLNFMGTKVARITPDYVIHLEDGIEVLGDAKLAESLKSGKISDITARERFPPVFVVVFDDGVRKAYQSRRP